MKEKVEYSPTTSMIAELVLMKVKRMFAPEYYAQAVRGVVCLLLTTVPSSFLVNLRENVEDIKREMEEKGDKLSNIN